MEKNSLLIVGTWKPIGKMGTDKDGYSFGSTVYPMYRITQQASFLHIR